MRKAINIFAMIFASTCFTVSTASAEWVYDPDSMVMWSKGDGSILLQCVNGEMIIAYSPPKEMGSIDFLLPLSGGSQPQDADGVRIRDLSPLVYMKIGNDSGSPSARLTGTSLTENLSNPGKASILSRFVSKDELRDVLGVIETAHNKVVIEFEFNSGNSAIDSIYNGVEWSVSADQSTLATRGIAPRFKAGGCL